MAHNLLLAEYFAMPPVTRAYTTACVLTTLAVQLDLLTPFDIYFNPVLVFERGQIWRLVTSFCFFGQLGFHFLFNLIFAYRYIFNFAIIVFRLCWLNFVLLHYILVTCTLDTAKCWKTIPIPGEPPIWFSCAFSAVY